MRNEVIFAIRDARGLKIHEKSFLFVCESRGKEGMFSEHDTNYTDMSMSKATYYRVRDSLIEKKLIEPRRRYNNTTVYHVNYDVLSAYVKSQPETQSHTETPESHTETFESQRAETKKNQKNIKKNFNESASASSLSKDKNETDKEDQDVLPASPIGANQSVPAQSPIEETTKAESQSETPLNPRNLTDAQRRRLHWDDPLYLPPLPKPAPVKPELEW